MGAVRLDAAQVGFDEQVGDDGGFVGVDAEPAEDPADGGAEGIGGDGDGGFGHGAGSSRDPDRNAAPGSRRDVTLDRDSVQRSLRAAGVADHRVLRGAVVPDDHVAGRPAVAVGVLGRATCS